MAFIFERQIQDANFVKAKALPAAGANNNSATFDLGSRVGFSPEEIVFEVDLPALTAHTDSTKNVTLTVQHSDDDSTYVNLDDGIGSPTGAPAQITITTPGVASTGTAARKVFVRLSGQGLKRYVQFNQAVTSGGPTLTASSVTYSLRF